MVCVRRALRSTGKFSPISPCGIRRRLSSWRRSRRRLYRMGLDELRERLKEIPHADARRLQELKTELLGRKAGALTEILKSLPSLDTDTRRQVGAAANALKRELERAIEAREGDLKRGAGDLADVDLTMPGRRQWRGVLRTHTSPVQIRTLETYPPPIRIVVPGRCYRRDPFDASHSPVFEQIEGFAVDEGITFVDFKATLAAFARRIFTPTTKVRFRPSYFPFTEPSAEMDVQCQICGGSGCAACKQTGWMEILGSGMVHPAVLENCKVDSEKYTGFAWGMGPERIAMLRYEIPDIRLFFDSDVRFLDQFAGSGGAWGLGPRAPAPKPQAP